MKLLLWFWLTFAIFSQMSGQILKDSTILDMHSLLPWPAASSRTFSFWWRVCLVIWRSVWEEGWREGINQEQLLPCSSQLSVEYLKLKTRKHLSKIIKLLLNQSNRKEKKVNQNKFKVLKIYRRFKRNQNLVNIQRKERNRNWKRAKKHSKRRKRVLRLLILRI